MIRIAGADLDSSYAPDEFTFTSSGNEECSRRTGNTKTDVVVPVVRIVPVAVSRAAVLRIVVPRTAAQQFNDRPHCKLICL